MKTYRISTYIGEDDCDVVAHFQPGDPGCHTMRNGDPGWPATDAEVEVESVRVDGREVSESDYTLAEWDAFHARVEELCDEMFRDEIERAWSSLREIGECDGLR